MRLFEVTVYDTSLPGERKVLAINPQRVVGIGKLPMPDNHGGHCELMVDGGGQFSYNIFSCFENYEVVCKRFNEAMAEEFPLYRLTPLRGDENEQSG